MTRERIITAINWFCLGLIIVLIMAPAWAQHECQGGHNCNDGGEIVVNPVLTGGDIGGDSSKVYALSGGDMDIDDCLATYSVVFGLFQGTNINRLCEAERLNAQGKYQSAAEMKCSLFRFKRIYGKGQKCIDAVIRTAPPPPVAVVPNDDRYDALQARMAAYEGEIAEAKAEAEKAAQRPTPQPQTIIQQQEFINESKRAKLAALRGEK